MCFSFTPLLEKRGCIRGVEGRVVKRECDAEEGGMVTVTIQTTEIIHLLKEIPREMKVKLAVVCKNWGLP